MQITGVASAPIAVPDEDIYTLECVSVDEQNIKPGFGNDENIDEYSLKIGFEIVDYDIEDSEDGTDWNGAYVSGFATWQRYDKAKDKMYSTYLSEKSKAHAMFSALEGRKVTEDDEINTSAWIGRRIRGTVVENKNGYPAIENPIKTRQKKAKAQTRVEAEEESVSPF